MSRARYDAYKFVTQVVSPYATGDEVVVQLKNSKPLDWELVASIAAAHSIVQALHPAFVEKELITYIPDEFVTYVEHMYELNCERNEMMRKQLINATLIINDMGIQPLLMKGAAHLFLDTFANKGDRLLTDLDILVPFDEIERVSNKLATAGYKLSNDKMHFIQTHHHYPPLIKQGECAAIELHRDLMFREQQHLFPTALAWDNAGDIELPNSAQAKVLTPNYRILHSFIHSCMVDKLYQAGHVEIRQLHELACSHFANASKVDWQEIADYACKRGIAKQWFANLYMISKFMHVSELEQANNRCLPNSVCQYTRVCSKLKYDWFNTLDARIVRCIKRWQSRTMALNQIST